MLKRKGCLIIAEAGVNHNGNIDLAFELCKAAKDAGADVVKFQTWKTEKIITHNVKQAEYQIANTGKMESQFDMLKKLELTYEEFKRIKKYCDDIGIIFASTADEEDSLDFLVTLDIPFIKVASSDIGNVSYLRYIGSKKIPIILSTGMSSLADVDISIRTLREGGAGNITILHCTTNYPCPIEEVNLNAMLTLKNAFHVPVGYSDHTIGIEVPIAAVAMGAQVIEKHFTLDRRMEGPDHLASMEPMTFKRMVQQIRNIECAKGDGIKKISLSEKKTIRVVKKRIVAKSYIEIGEKFSENNICVKRNNSGLMAHEWDLVIGRKALQIYKPDMGITI